MSELWDKALRAADEARLLIQQGHPNGGVSRAYYAAFTAARVLLIEKAGYEERDIRRHSAVLRIFSEHFVKTELVDRELGRGFRNLFDDRVSADYQTTSVDEIEAREAIDFMERFLAAISKLRQQDQP